MKAAKVGRRLSARIGTLFRAKSSKDEASHPAKVEEHPPKIEEPAPVAPLENPASEGEAKKEETPAPAATEEPSKPAEPTPTPVAAAA